MRHSFDAVVLLAAVSSVLLFTGCGQNKSSSKLAPGAKKLGLVYFAPEEGADICIRGLFDGLKEAGFTEGNNLEVRRSHANAEIATISSLIQNYDNSDVDAIVTLTTPCLTGAAANARRKPVVFTYVYDPIAAGAAKSFEDHLPFLTGVGSFPPVGDTVELIRKIVPGVKAVGTLYNASEANSRKVVSVGRDLFQKAGIKLEEVTIGSTNEIMQAAQALSHRGIQAMWVTGDNTALQGFAGIGRVARDAKIPLIINDPEFTGKGAAVAVGLGWHEPGVAAGKVLARILNGESPKDIPIQNVAIQKLVVNDDVVAALGLQIPPEMLKSADHVKMDSK